MKLNFEPKKVWEIFENIFLATPRTSGHEKEVTERLMQYLGEKADSDNIPLTVKKDGVGNLLVTRTPSPDKKDFPVIMLQAHLDMVYVKRGEEAPPEGAPITPIITEDEKGNLWVKGNGTSLGADNGIGAAIVAAILTEPYPEAGFGRIIGLFTVGEEGGLTGAYGFDPKSLEVNPAYLINVDSEELGTITIGCAGGTSVKMFPEFDAVEPPENGVLLELNIGGLKGGHSGVDINKPHASANVLSARIMHVITSSEELFDSVYISNWNGGDANNAIAKSCTVKFIVPGDSKEKVLRIAEEEIEYLYKYYQSLKDKEPEPDMFIKITKIEEKDSDDKIRVISPRDGYRLINLLLSIPHGVKSFAFNDPSTVETSNNLGTVRTEYISGRNTLKFTIGCMPRSNLNREIRSYAEIIAAPARLAGINAEIGKGYPAWTPEYDSPFVKTAAEIYGRILGRKIKIEAVHAGLETAVFKKSLPETEMISIGPTINKPHSTDESLAVKDVKIVYEYIIELLRNPPDRR